MCNDIFWHEHPAQMFFLKEFLLRQNIQFTFKTDDNNIISTQIVEEGNPVFAPQAPIEKREFVDWEGDGKSNKFPMQNVKHNKLPENNNGS